MKIVVIGGGPAGMMAAITASKFLIENRGKALKSSQVFILEKNEKLGKKLFITGKGRCNLTNNCEKEEFFKNVVKNSKFIYSAFASFSNKDMQEFVECNGCKLKIERGNRVFPISDRSIDVIDAFKYALKDKKVQIKLNSEVKNIKLEKLNNKMNYIKNSDKELQYQQSEFHKFNIELKNGEKIVADKVIIATGGLSYSSTGSTGDGYKFAKSFGINLISQSPSLVPICVKEINECKLMQGLTLKNIAISVIDKTNNKKIYSDFGELLFTHFGVSGPVILSLSCFVDLPYDDKVISDSNLVLSIDLKPALSIEQINNRLIREFEENNNKKLKSVIENLLPSSMVEVFLCRLNKKHFKDVGSIKNSDVTKELRKLIIDLLKDFRYDILRKRGFDESIVTSGGIDVNEINPKTMESKKIKGLYFAGEVIDVDALTGGFNIQIASSTGYLAGKSAVCN